jgi:AcrR family transcriptional regulator
MTAGEPRPRATRPYHHGNLRQALVDAAFALVTEEQSWSFSLREVARRAGVSHNAPYNHFAEKRDLLSAVAVAGFDLLRGRMTAAADAAPTGEAALIAASHAYAGLALENPALYRLMFGPELAEDLCPPAEAVKEAGEATRACVDAVILRAAREGLFAAGPEDEAELSLVALSCWSMMHGLVMLIIDGRAEALDLPAPALVEALMERLLRGLVRR